VTEICQDILTTFFNNVIVILEVISVVNEESTKMTVYVDTTIHTEIKVLAAQTKRKISDVVGEALVEYLQKRKEDK
jgi:hypothetical protein